MELLDVLAAFGGCARREQLAGVVSRRGLTAAVRRGEIVKQGRAYARPDSDDAIVLARRLHGVASHRSAARRHGFALPPGEPGDDVMVPPKSKRRHVPDNARMHWGLVPADDLRRGCTNRLLTVVHCLRDLPLREALSVGDSALRAGTVDSDALARAVAALRGPGSAVARARLAQLDARAENAFESSARALLIEAGILGFQPQVGIRHRRQWIGRVDLADLVRRIVIECDGFATHGGRAAFVTDLTRHTQLVAAGWLPLRFTWEQVMFHADWVIEMVRDTVAAAERSAKTTQRAKTRLPRAA